MNRRDFVRFLGLGLAGACAGGQVYWPREAEPRPRRYAWPSWPTPI